MLLVDQGRTSLVITPIGGQSPADPVGFAAEELQKYVYLITGARLGIAEHQSGPGSVAALALAPRGTSSEQVVAGIQSASVELCGRHPDGYSINLNSPVGVLASRSERGVLYSTYRLLEQVGVRFFAPRFPTYRGHHEKIPAANTLDVGLSVTESPSFDIRRADAGEGWSIDSDALVAIIDWMAKQRRNTLVFPYDDEGRGLVRWDDYREHVLPELARRAIAVETGGHGYQSFLKPSDLEPAHPDWFGGVDEPTATGEPPPTVFKAEHPEAVQTYVDAVVDYLADRPEVSIFEAWPPDFARWAESTVDRFGTMSNAQAHVTNRLCAELRNNRLPVTVATLSYTPALDPPDPEYGYHEDVIVDFAPLDRDYGAPIFSPDQPRNAEWPSLLSRWRDAGFAGKVGWYEYYRKMAWHSLPVLLPHLMSKEIPFYRSLGVAAFGSGTYVVPGDWLTYELVHQLISALSWDVSLDYREFIESYLSARFSGSASTMATILERFEDAGGTFFKGFLGSYEDASVTENTARVYRDCLADVKSVDPADDAEALMVSALAANLEFAVADMEMGISSQSTRPDAAERLQYDRTALHAARLGAVLYSPWLDSRRANPSDMARGSARKDEPVEQYFAFYGREFADSK